MDLRPRLLQTRFLFPFIFEPGQFSNVVGELEMLHWSLKGRDVQVWTRYDSLPERYLAEILPHVGDFLGKAQPEVQSESVSKGGSRLMSGGESAVTNEQQSRGNGDAAGSDSCRYLKVNSELLDAWFRRGLEVHETEAFPAENGEIFRAALVHEIGIEAFLSPFGGGILSIALETECRPAVAGADPAASMTDAETQLLQFNYRLAQYKEKSKLVPWLTLPPPPPKSDKYPKGYVPPSYSDVAKKGRHTLPDLEQRLGKIGMAFLLPELVRFLLKLPAGSGGEQNSSPMFVPTQDQFSTYTVVQFGCEVDFANDTTLARLGPLVSGLAQIEEPTHAGHAVSGDLDLPSAVMNRRHWAAVGYLAATHFVADQAPPHPYNEQRLRTVRDKYFVPYLLAYFQRLGFHRCLIRTRAILALQGKEPLQSVQLFNELQGDWLRFRLASDFLEISSREALDRYYRVARQGLGVGIAQEAIGRSIDEFNAMNNAGTMIVHAAASRAATEDVASIQKKLEVLEVLFVAIYVTELAHFMVGENELKRVLYILFFGSVGAVLASNHLISPKNKKVAFLFIFWVTAICFVSWYFLIPHDSRPMFSYFYLSV